MNIQGSVLNSINIAHNQPCYDGTPRREKGWRAYVGLKSYPSRAQPFLSGIIIESPLFDTRADLNDWLRDVAM